MTLRSRAWVCNCIFGKDWTEWLESAGAMRVGGNSGSRGKSRNPEGFALSSCSRNEERDGNQIGSGSIRLRGEISWVRRGAE